MPRRNRNAYRSPEKRRLIIEAEPSLIQLQPRTRRERRKAQRAFNNERRAA